jgi:uncharacterized protein (TIGR03437 family)
MSVSRNVIFLALFFSGALAAQPVVFEGGAVNVASYVPAQFPNYGIAQGSLFTVFGEEMGPAQIVFVQAFPVGTTLAGSSIKVTVGNTTVDCLMIFSSAGQLAAVLPSTTPVGQGTLTVTYNGQVSNAIAIPVVEHAPGIFTISQNGLGPAVVTDPNFIANTVVNSFAPGDVGVLWTTGLGARSQDATPQAEDLQGGLDLTLRIGSKTVTDFIYAGPAPTNAGLDQINFMIPEDAEEGCAVSVVLQVGDAVSNFTLMSIASDNLVCDDDPLALTRAEIQKQQADLSLRVALAQFDSNFTNAAVITPNPAIDSPGSHDGRVDTIRWRLFDAPWNPANPVLGLAPGSCNVIDQIYTNPAPPSATNPLPGGLAPVGFTTDPNNMMLTLPANLLLSDNNTPQSPADFTLVQGQEWRADIAIVDPALMRTDEGQVSHVLRMNPEDFAAWDPSSAEQQFIGVLRGDPILQDLVIHNLSTSSDHLVVGTFVVQNPFWRTTISCTTPGDQPFVIPQYVFGSINCGPQSLCNGNAVLNILHRGPSVAGTTLGSENSIGKINGFDRVLIFFSFTLPAAVAKQPQMP